MNAALAPGAASSIVAIPNADEPRRYIVRVELRDDDGWLVHIADAHVASAMPDALARALGLTGSAGQLVASLVNGDDLATHAARAGISINTARFHLRGAFDATGTRRQADLVRLAMSVLGQLSL